MKLNKNIITIVLLITIIIIIGILYLKNRINVPHQDATISKEVEELKQEIGVVANSKLYDIQIEYDGRKVLNIKPEIQYKIAFVGIINNQIPTLEQVDSIFKNEYPENNGIWIEDNSRKAFLKLLNENTNNQYEITEQGYLRIVEEINQNEEDKTLKKMINANKQYIITISGTYYEADYVTGEILDNFYEEMDPYQASKIVEWDDNFLIFLSTNKENKLTNKQILQELTRYGK